MGTRTADDSDRDPFGADAVVPGRYAEIRIGDHEVLIYDTEAEDAWLQSESAVGLERMA